MSRARDVAWAWLACAFVLLVATSVLRAIGDAGSDSVQDATLHATRVALILVAGCFAALGATIAPMRLRDKLIVFGTLFVGVASIAALPGSDPATTPTPEEVPSALLLAGSWFVLVGWAALRTLRIRSTVTSPVARGRLRWMTASLTILAVSIPIAVLVNSLALKGAGRTGLTLALLTLAIALWSPRLLRESWRASLLSSTQQANAIAISTEDEQEACLAVVPVITRLLGARSAVVHRHDEVLYALESNESASYPGPTRTIDLPLFTSGAHITLHGVPRSLLVGEPDVRPAKVLVTTLDLSLDRIDRLDRDRARASRLTRADRVKDAFLAAVSHDLRNPLMAISGLARTLRDDVHGRRLPPDMRDQVANELLESTNRLERMLDGLLDLARARHGRLSLDAERLDLLQLVRDAARSAPATDAELVVDGSPGSATVDRGKFARIVESLVLNAERHSPPGSRIVVTVEPQPDTGTISMHVDDEGSGMSLDDRIALFEALAAGGVTRSGSGTGIGLALAARFTDLHGGRLEVGDSPLGGARFTVRIPTSGAPAGPDG